MQSQIKLIRLLEEKATFPFYIKIASISTNKVFFFFLLLRFNKWLLSIFCVAECH